MRSQMPALGLREYWYPALAEGAAVRARRSTTVRISERTSCSSGEAWRGWRPSPLSCTSRSAFSRYASAMSRSEGAGGGLCGRSGARSGFRARRGRGRSTRHRRPGGVFVDEPDDQRCRGSSSRAKKADLDSTRQGNTLGRCAVIEAFAGPVVEPVRDRVELGLAVGGEVGALR